MRGYQVKDPATRKILGVVVLVVFAISLIYNYSRTSTIKRDFEAAYSGEVVRRTFLLKGDSYNDSARGDDRYYFLYIKTADGKEEKRYCPAAAYERCRKKNFVVKKAGAENLPHPLNHKEIGAILDAEDPMKAARKEGLTEEGLEHLKRFYNR